MTDSSRVAIMAETETQDELSMCPTFNSYSSDRLADIAARVTGEFDNLSVLREEKDDDDCGDDEFEFSLLRDGSEIFYDGQFGPVFPVFNRDLADGFGDGRLGTECGDGAVVETEIGVPLRKLFVQERREEEEQGNNPPSSSSSEADEMEGVPTGTYCVWRPKKFEPSPASLGKKSNSAGSGSGSKRWKFLNLLRRSNSEGKDTYVFFTPKNREVKSGSGRDESHRSGEIVKSGQKQKPRTSTELPWNSPSNHSQSPLRSPAHEAFYLHNRAIKQGEKKKSYLPYKKDLVGFFANVNGLSRTLSPF
ncbi:OLC1v1011378C1 [Oldenlandia corymbosa var. corymbosa]|uniref:OLC1v1011378C1 n=1 Tax=Oldenlandia corymbosa var. corymbosa TaxID=529605 RepID=A0AAV1DTJ9_OLDCO|nr:OLC1v1011378C1 [Oldenlandia corymbosa var. corymbosa]